VVGLIEADVGVRDSRPTSPRPRCELIGNRPNPFNPSTAIDFRTARAGHARLRVFDLSGRLVASLVDSVLPAGAHSVRWTGVNQHGLPVGSGVYLYRLRAGGETQTKRMVILE